ncbi:hypothetical protein [Actinokineospora sp.]|uniref:hypothetical protein n=1 Tax=Actinokineospora sp. TaxID=1872133 RepID=UPI0040378902
MRTPRLRKTVRWLLAAVLVAAATVNTYIAFAQSVVWPAPLAVVWIGIAAALITPPEDSAAAGPPAVAPAPEQRTLPV